MTVLWEPSDLNTHVYFSALPGNSAAVSAPYGCGCTLPDACPSCDGVAAEEGWREQLADIRAVRDAWRAGELSAREFYLRSMAVSFDGLPDVAAVKAMERAGWPTADDERSEVAA